MSKIIRNKHVLLTTHEYGALSKVLDSKALSGTSPIIGDYESELAQYFGVDHAVACSSGTSAIYASLLALDVKPNDEVVLPPTAPVMTALPILEIGAVPVFVDTKSSSSFGLSADHLSRRLTPRTKAIIDVPMWGYPSWEEDVERLCKQKGIPIIEDAAQAHGSITGGKLVGTRGVLGCFSTHERKLISTGEGGFILTSDDRLAKRLREICFFGKQIIPRETLQHYVGKFGATFGLNLKLNSLAAALGICQIQKLRERIATRSRNAAQLREGLQEVHWLTEICVRPVDRPNYYSIVFGVDPAFATARKIGERLSEQNIISDTFDYDYRPLYELPIFCERVATCPNAEGLTRRAITLPTHEGLTPDDINYVIASIKKLNPKP